MTVPLQVPVSSATANGVATVFPYSFKILDADDLSVTLDGVEQTSGFTVSGVGNYLGGDVTFSVAPADTTAVVLALDPVLERTTDYQQFGDFLSPTVNGDFDRLWLTLQKFANDFKRSLKLPVDTASDQLIDSTAGERANALVTFDASGNLTITPITSIAVNVSAGSFTVDTFSGTGAQTVFTLSRDPGILNNTTVFVGGAYLRKDQYSISGTTLTFDVAPASGTANIEVCQSVALEAGSPADGTVTVASFAAGALAASATGLAKMADGFLAASTAGRLKMADKFVTLAKMNDMATGKLLGNVSGVTGAPAEVAEASQAEAEAGALQTRWMTPLRTAQAIAALSSITTGTAIPTTSGVAADFTSIPAGTKRITVALNGVSTLGTSPLLIQLGTGGVPTTSGYNAYGAGFTTASMASIAFTTGFGVSNTIDNSAETFHGQLVFTHAGSNTWVMSGAGRRVGLTNGGAACGGAVTLAGVLNFLRLTSVSGDTFDAGSVNILYE